MATRRTVSFSVKDVFSNRGRSQQQVTHPDLASLSSHLLQNSAIHSQVKCAPIRKKPAKQTEKTSTLNSLCFHLPNNMFFFSGSFGVSNGSEILLWRPRKIYDWNRTDFTWQWAQTGLVLSYEAQLLFILQILILGPVNYHTFLLLGEELHSWNHSQENNPFLPDHPEL